MTLAPEELLSRLSATLRSDIAPGVTDEYTRTQAFMASVILERLARHVELAPEHEVAERDDVERVCAALGTALDDAPDAVREALRGATGSGTVAALGPLVDALYEWGAERSDVLRALELIRPVLRRDIDRRMEVAT